MVIKNKSVSLLWELNSIFSGKFFKRIAHVRYIEFKHDSEAFWSFFYIWFGLRELKSLLGITRQWSREKLQYCPYSLGIMLEFKYIERGLLARAKRTMNDANFTGNGFIQHHGGFDTSYQGRML